MLYTLFYLHFITGNIDLQKLSEPIALQKYIFASGQKSYRHAEHFAYKMGAVKTSYFDFIKM